MAGTPVVPIPKELAAVEVGVLQDYVKACFQQEKERFVQELAQRLSSEYQQLSPEAVRRCATEVTGLLRATVAEPTSLKEPRLQLKFWHSCKAQGCLDKTCSLCQNSPQRLCSRLFSPEYQPAEPLRAACTAGLWVQLVDTATGNVMRDTPHMQLEVFLVNHARLPPGNVKDLGAAALSHAAQGSMLRTGSGGTGGTKAEPDGIIKLVMKNGKVQLPDLSVTHSSLSQDSHSALMLCVRLAAEGGSQEGVKAALSEPFIVSPHSEKQRVSSLSDHVSQLKDIKQEAVAKLSSIHQTLGPMAFQLGLVLPAVATVGELRVLLEVVGQRPMLEEQLQQVLQLPPLAWSSLRAQVAAAVAPDSRARVWYADRNKEAGLMFRCQDGVIDFATPPGFIMYDADGKATLATQLDPVMQEEVHELAAVAQRQWHCRGHPGWEILPKHVEQSLQRFSGLSSGELALDPGPSVQRPAGSGLPDGLPLGLSPLGSLTNSVELMDTSQHGPDGEGGEPPAPGPNHMGGLPIGVYPTISTESKVAGSGANASPRTAGSTPDHSVAIAARAQDPAMSFQWSPPEGGEAGCAVAQAGGGGGGGGSGGGRGGYSMGGRSPGRHSDVGMGPSPTPPKQQQVQASRGGMPAAVGAGGLPQGVYPLNPGGPAVGALQGAGVAAGGQLPNGGTAASSLSRLHNWLNPAGRPASGPADTDHGQPLPTQAMHATGLPAGSQHQHQHPLQAQQWQAAPGQAGPGGQPAWSHNMLAGIIGPMPTTTPPLASLPVVTTTVGRGRPGSNASGSRSAHSVITCQPVVLSKPGGSKGAKDQGQAHGQPQVPAGATVLGAGSAGTLAAGPPHMQAGPAPVPTPTSAPGHLPSYGSGDAMHGMTLGAALTHSLNNRGMDQGGHHGLPQGMGKGSQPQGGGGGMNGSPLCQSPTHLSENSLDMSTPFALGLPQGSPRDVSSASLTYRPPLPDLAMLQEGTRSDTALLPNPPAALQQSHSDPSAVIPLVGMSGSGRLGSGGLVAGRLGSGSLGSAGLGSGGPGSSTLGTTYSGPASTGRNNSPHGNWQLPAVSFSILDAQQWQPSSLQSQPSASGIFSASSKFASSARHGRGGPGRGRGSSGSQHPQHGTHPTPAPAPAETPFSNEPRKRGRSGMPSSESRDNLAGQGRSGRSSLDHGSQGMGGTGAAGTAGMGGSVGTAAAPAAGVFTVDQVAGAGMVGSGGGGGRSSPCQASSGMSGGSPLHLGSTHQPYGVPSYGGSGASGGASLLGGYPGPHPHLMHAGPHYPAGSAEHTSPDLAAPSSHASSGSHLTNSGMQRAATSPFPIPQPLALQHAAYPGSSPEGSPHMGNCPQGMARSAHFSSSPHGPMASTSSLLSPSRPMVSPGTSPTSEEPPLLRRPGSLSIPFGRDEVGNVSFNAWSSVDIDKLAQTEPMVQDAQALSLGLPPPPPPGLLESPTQVLADLGYTAPILPTSQPVDPPVVSLTDPPVVSLPHGPRMLHGPGGGAGDEGMDTHVDIMLHEETAFANQSEALRTALAAAASLGMPLGMPPGSLGMPAGSLGMPPGSLGMPAGSLGMPAVSGALVLPGIPSDMMLPGLNSLGVDSIPLSQMCGLPGTVPSVDLTLAGLSAASINNLVNSLALPAMGGAGEPPPLSRQGSGGVHPGGGGSGLKPQGPPSTAPQQPTSRPAAAAAAAPAASQPLLAHDFPAGRKTSSPAGRPPPPALPPLPDLSHDMDADLADVSVFEAVQLGALNFEGMGGSSAPAKPLLESMSLEMGSLPLPPVVPSLDLQAASLESLGQLPEVPSGLIDPSRVTSMELACSLSSLSLSLADRHLRSLNLERPS